MELTDNTLSTILAISSGFLFALSIQLQNLGLQNSDPRTGALISISSTTAVYWAFAPFVLESSYWLSWGTLCFIIVGLFRPALSVNLAMGSIKYMGPTLTSAIAATNPIFGVFFAVLLLGEVLSAPVALGTGAVVIGIIIGSIKTGSLIRGWPLWAILLPLGAAFFRAAGHPITMIGYETVPSPYFAGLVSYTTSFFVSSIAFRFEGRRLPMLTPNYWWFVVSGSINGLSLYSLNYALKVGQLLTVSPIVACSPVFTMLLGLFVFKKEVITLRTIITILLVVLGVVMVITGGP